MMYSVISYLIVSTATLYLCFLYFCIRYNSFKKIGLVYKFYLGGIVMEYRELSRLQEKAMCVYTGYSQVNFNDANAVLNFLWEIHPYMIDRNLNLPKEHLMHLLVRHGYGEMNDKTDNTHRMIINLIKDIEIEEFMNCIQMKNMSFN